MHYFADFARCFQQSSLQISVTFMHRRKARRGTASNVLAVASFRIQQIQPAQPLDRNSLVFVNF